ncbi:hypothetical protein EIP91_001490 [Steccherinum ochraceum]|uniref:Major facilitator superfamily (MFS) profile domain-containing protein n=1 Tax=Steccherinum ochraceum TaxID=92696 RepID=A0A4R0RPM6_9APHY|nr:hypothetical protein EIP91_001490 [Steccherinum ochraceum]
MSSSDSSSPTFSPGLPLDKTREHEMTRRILWKLDIRVVPVLCLLYVSSFLDRASISNARIAGLERDTHLVGNQYNTVLAVFYVSYVLVNLPSNLILKKIGANRWLPFLVTAWGAVTALTGLVNNFSGLLAARFFLGLCEGGLLSGLMLYLSTMYKRHELQKRAGLFISMSSLSGAFGGLLASAIVKMDGVGGLAGWRWILILEGIATALLSIVAVFCLPRGIASAKFLTDEERQFALTRLREADIARIDAPSRGSTEKIDVTADDLEKKSPATSTAPVYEIYDDHEQFEWREVVRGICDPQTLMMSVSGLGMLCSAYSFAYFLPSIVTGLGYSGEEAQLRTSPPYIPAAVLTVLAAFLCDRLRWRAPVMMMVLPIAMLGYIISIVATDVLDAQNNTQRYAAVFLIQAGIWPCVPCMLSLLPNNTSGHYKRATAIAFQAGAANSSGFIATFLYTADQAPHYIRGHSITLAFVVLAWIAAACNVVYCRWENNARASGRREGNIRAYQELWDSGKTRAPIGDRHPDFRFTL